MIERSGILMKTLTAFLVLATLILVAWYLVFYICNKRNDLAESQIAKLIPLIADYYSVHNEYPENIEKLEGFKAIMNDKAVLIFSGVPIEYQRINDGFKIYYHEAPLGPFHGYDSKTGDWYYEE